MVILGVVKEKKIEQTVNQTLRSLFHPQSPPGKAKDGKILASQRHKDRKGKHKTNFGFGNANLGKPAGSEKGMKIGDHELHEFTKRAG